MGEVQLYDTTLRDGSQSEGISFSLADKLKIVAKLDELGIHYIEGGWPGSNPKDMEFYERVRNLRLLNSVVAAFTSTRRAKLPVDEDASIAAVLVAAPRVATVVGKSWDLHVTEVLRTSLDENLRMIEDTVRYLRARGLRDALTKKYLEMRTTGTSPQELNDYLNAHSQYYSQHLVEVEDAEICCGQVAGLIDGVKGARETIEDIAKDINARFKDLKKKMTAFL